MSLSPLPVPTGGGGGEEGNRVLLHVYDLPNSSVGLLNSIFYTLSIGGLYHTGLEINGIEYSYGSSLSGTGIFASRPKEGEGWRCTIDFGRVRTRRGESRRTLFGRGCLVGEEGDEDFIDGNELVLRLASEWLGTEYSLLHKNCVSFCRELAFKLGIEERDFPDWVYSFTEAADGLFGIHSFSETNTDASSTAAKDQIDPPSPAKQGKKGGGRKTESPVVTDCEIDMLNEAAARMCMDQGIEGDGGVEDELAKTVSDLDTKINNFNAYSRSFDKTGSSMTVLYSSMTESTTGSTEFKPMPQDFEMTIKTLTVSEMEALSDSDNATSRTNSPNPKQNSQQKTTHQRNDTNDTVGTVEYIDTDRESEYGNSF